MTMLKRNEKIAGAVGVIGAMEQAMNLLDMMLQDLNPELIAYSDKAYDELLVIINTFEKELAQ